MPDPIIATSIQQPVLPRLDDPVLTTYLEQQRRMIDRLWGTLMALVSERAGVGIHADRPDPGQKGRLYLSTDTAKFSIDDGSAWTEMNIP